MTIRIAPAALRVGGLAICLLVTCFAPAALAQCTASWSPATPAPRYGHAMAYDSLRATTVIFGGTNGISPIGETWEWNGTSRQLKSTSGPTARESTAMAYDATRGVTVLFGGYANGASLNDTWEWNGSTWTQRAIAGPTQRYGHAMAYDSVRQRIVLFGGDDGAARKNDTWEYNGTSWTQVPVSGPSGRRGHSMTFAANRGRVVLHGGDDGVPNSQTWEYNGSAWVLAGTAAPAAVTSSALAYDSESGLVIFFGGYNGTFNGETWSWNGTAWTLRSASGPTARGFHAMAYDSVRDRVVLYGGQEATTNNGDIWEYNQNSTSWSLRTSNSPTARFWHAMTYDSGRQRVVLFGGQDPFALSGETWELDSANWVQRVVAGPTPRYWHAMAYDSTRAVTVLFGGNTGGRNSETWEWNGTAWTQRMIAGPSARDGHAMAYDANRQRIVLFGGQDALNTLKGDTWEFDGTSWSQRATTGPSARYWHTMTYDSNRQRVVLYGGINSIGLANDIWEWNGTSWTQRIAGGGPSPGRSGATLTYDSNRGRAVLFGGYDGIAKGDTWELNLNGASPTWAAQPPGGPPARQRHAAAFAANRSAVVIFGGTLTGTGQLGDTWQYGAGSGFPTITQQPSSLTRCLGQQATFGVTVSGSGVTYQWRKNASNIAGASTPQYNIASVSAADGATYDVVITNACGSITSAAAVLTVASAPTISQQPLSQSRCVGQPASFTVGATGTNLSYQWRKGVNNIGGATNPTYTIASPTTGDAGSYSCVVTNDCGSVTSNNATLAVDAPPTINTHPQGQTVCSGQIALFTVSASGAGSLTYQWRKNTLPILNANSASYEIFSTVANDAGSYDCVVTSGCGNATSNAATLVVNDAPAITQQPAGAARCVGGAVTFSVTVSGGGTPTYQWRKGGFNIGGATSSSYTLNTLGLSDAGSYDCVISSACGNVTSSAAVLTVSDGPTISQHPASQTVCAGGSANLTVSASGGAPLSYQWRREGFDIPGATGSSFLISSASEADAGNYSVRVTDPCGTRTSNTAVISIGAGQPSITQQPAAATVCVGQPASFTVAASGAGTLSYQWRRGGQNIGGATGTTYSIAAVSPGDVGDYDCVVADSCGTITSDTAALTLGGAAPQITQQPVGLTTCANQLVTLTVTASGNGPLQYQWRKGSVNIGGATSSSYSIPSAQPTDSGSYDVVISDNCGQATSNAAVVSVGAGQPTITQQPTPQTACPGTTAQFTIGAAGTGTLTYQWRKGGNNIAGANAAILSLPNVGPGDAANYDCIVTDNCGSRTSNSVALTVGGTGPTILQQPLGGFTCRGDSFSFSVLASGPGPFTYVWRRGATVIPSASGPLFTIDAAQPSDTASYTCQINNPCGSVTSDAASLIVTVKGDANCDGAFTNFDIDPFVFHLIFGQAAWEAQYGCDFICANDIDNSGDVTNFDIDPFVNLLVNGP